MQWIFSRSFRKKSFFQTRWNSQVEMFWLTFTMFCNYFFIFLISFSCRSHLLSLAMSCISTNFITFSNNVELFADLSPQDFITREFSSHHQQQPEWWVQIDKYYLNNSYVHVKSNEIKKKKRNVTEWVTTCDKLDCWSTCELKGRVPADCIIVVCNRSCLAHEKP